MDGFITGIDDGIDSHDGQRCRRQCYGFGCLGCNG